MDANNSAEIIYNGRVNKQRYFGKLLFLDIISNGKLVQGVFKRELLEDNFPKKGTIHVGDVVSVKGEKSPSDKRKESIEVAEFSVLSRNQSEILIEPINQNLVKRSEMNYQLRKFLREKEYTEVELPVLHKGKIPSKSREFSTAHVTIGDGLHLRKSTDVFLRKLALQGLDKVYSIGPNFRNEYISRDKIPEFNMLSLIKNYSSVSDLISLLRELINVTFQKLSPDSLLASEDIPVISYEEFISEFKDSENAYNKAKLNTTKPCIIYGFPACTNSVAQISNNTSEEFKLIFDGYTLVHGYSELNDPIKLRERLSQQRDFKETGELEELLKDMEKGCPPATSMGLSLDRLSMILCGAQNIRKVIAFPFSRLEKQNG